MYCWAQRLYQSHTKQQNKLATVSPSRRYALRYEQKLNWFFGEIRLLYVIVYIAVEQITVVPSQIIRSALERSADTLSSFVSSGEISISATCGEGPW